ncbi:MAG: hypothetical protein L6R42_009244 [Xanthoria sp. 1 TBL-2021]|nr:MAG: hypothetical protein L6R42_009244 [Xanthoria sp. 1 TBL-2021]
MVFAWQTQKGPEIGLRRRKFPYGSLLEHRGNHSQPSENMQAAPTVVRGSSAEREKAEQEEADLYALPRSDSDEKSPSAPLSPKLESESPPPAKRRRLETRGSQQIDLTTSPSIKNERDPADIPKTTFTSSDPSSNHHSAITESKAPSSSLHSETVVKDDSDEPFAEYYASQPKTRKIYQRPAVNIHHNAAPVKPEKKQETTNGEKTERAVKLLSNGFMIANTEGICALVQDQRGRADVQRKKKPMVHGRLVGKLSRSPHQYQALRSENLPHGQNSKSRRVYLPA